MSANQAPRWQTVGLWIVTVLVGLVFIAGGGTKLVAMPPHPEHFAHWGYPLWFMYVTGAIELLGAILILVPRVAGLGALLLAGTMVGAIFTHLKAGEEKMVVAPLVLLVLIVVVGYARRHAVLGMLGMGPRTPHSP